MCFDDEIVPGKFSLLLNIHCNTVLQLKLNQELSQTCLYQYLTFKRSQGRVLNPDRSNPARGSQENVPSPITSQKGSHMGTKPLTGQRHARGVPKVDSARRHPVRRGTPSPIFDPYLSEVQKRKRGLGLIKSKVISSNRVL